MLSGTAACSLTGTHAGDKGLGPQFVDLADKGEGGLSSFAMAA